VDTFLPEKRSDIMRCVRSTDTAPERKVRSLLHKLGFRFRIHRLDLPGKPDIVLPKRRAVVFVHGCFWHRHQGCPHATTPASRQEYWLPKFRRTVDRDWKNQEELRQRGWNVLIVWECETRDLIKLSSRLVGLICHKPLVWKQFDPIISMAAEKQIDYNQ
jgi:DNA mismatch endonuclease (patch repair protein)